MRGNQDENILQEYELTGNWQCQQDGSDKSTSKEEGAVNDSPLVVLINLEDKCIIVLLGFFDFEEFKSF